MGQVWLTALPGSSSPSPGLGLRSAPDALAERPGAPTTPIFELTGSVTGSDHIGNHPDGDITYGEFETLDGGWPFFFLLTCAPVARHHLYHRLYPASSPARICWFSGEAPLFVHAQAPSGEGGRPAPDTFRSALGPVTRAVEPPGLRDFYPASVGSREVRRDADQRA